MQELKNREDYTIELKSKLMDLKIEYNFIDKIIVIALDMSGSMSGSRWNNVVKGAKQLVDYYRKNYANEESM